MNVTCSRLQYILLFLLKALLSLSFFAPICSQAEALKIVSADFDPYTYKTKSGGAGVMYEITRELARRVGQSPEIEFLPWSRAQTEAQTKSNIAILPLARVPEREAHYTWIAHVLNDPYVLFAKKGSTVDISSLEAAKKLRIGTFRGSLAEVLLPKLGFKNFRSVNHDAQNVKMLKSDRIDAWVAPLSFKDRYFDKGGLSGEDLRVGATLVMLHEYLAASKNVNPKIAKRWQDAFAEMKRDGTYATFMRKHGFEPLE